MGKEHDAGGDTLKVTDEYLKGVALNQINGFIRDLRANKAIAAVNGFAGGAGGLGAVAGEYTKLLTGGGTLSSAKDLQSRFQALCVSLQSELHALDKTMNDISADLQGAHQKLHNGEDDALSVADMMHVLDNVYNGLNGSGVPQPGDGNGKGK